MKARKNHAFHPQGLNLAARWLGQRFLTSVYNAGRQAQVHQQNGGKGTKRHIKNKVFRNLRACQRERVKSYLTYLVVLVKLMATTL